MSSPFEKPAVRVEAQPQLGAVLLDVSYPKPVLRSAVFHTPATLDDIVAELRGLRADLASRSFEARWMRLCRWLASFWRW